MPACDVFRVVLDSILACDFSLASRDGGLKEGFVGLDALQNHHSELNVARAFLWPWRMEIFVLPTATMALCHSSSNDAVSRHPHPIVHGAHTFRASTYVVVPRSEKALQLALIRSPLTSVITPVKVTM